MTATEDLARALARQSTSRSETAVFVRMDGRFAVVNVGTSTVTVPCVGFYPPVTGMPVRLDWVNGSPSVTGPVRPLNPMGVISAAGTPRAGVTVDGVEWTLPVMDSYTPVVGDQVAINWSMGVIMGKLAAVDSPEAPPESGGGEKPFTVTVRAAQSGRFQNSWWGNDPWASSNNDGIWTYGNRVRDAVGGGTVTSIQIYLPLVQKLGNCAIGVHPHSSIPGGAPAIGTLTTLSQSQRSGWVTLPTSFGTYVAAGGRGVGVTAPGGGYNIWRGVAADSLSGALRISGTR